MRRAILVAALTGVLHAPAASQEAHVFLVRGSSGDADFESTRGVGVALAFRIGDALRVQVGLDTRRARLRRVGIACINPQVGWRCATDEIATENRFSSFSVAVLPSWRPWDMLRVSAGAGVVVGSADSDNVASSGRQALIFVRETAQAGGVVVADAQLRPARSLPLVLVGQWQARRIALEGCSEIEDTYDPFCGTDWWSELQLGLGLRF
ncbi:MAG: hypothetical protein PVI57_07420 [Gemmatimonadota bacterium]|jgi:hypothetical protein